MVRESVLTIFLHKCINVQKVHVDDFPSLSRHNVWLVGVIAVLGSFFLLLVAQPTWT